MNDPFKVPKKVELPIKKSKVMEQLQATAKKQAKASFVDLQKKSKSLMKSQQDKAIARSRANDLRYKK